MASMEKKEPDSSVENVPPPPYCTLSEKEKIFTIIIVSMVAFLGPASGDIYYPALGSLARDLDVSESKINFTITSYMVGSFSLSLSGHY